MDRILVDGHNALHALRLARGAAHEEERRALLARVRAALPDALVYFDGRGAPPDLPRVFRQDGVKVHYCKRREADDEILADVRHADDARLLTVVTNDRELGGRCRQLGARVLGVGEALGRAPRRARRTPRTAAPHATPIAGAAPGDGPAAPPPEPLPKGDRPLRPADFGLPEVVDPSDPRWRR